MERNLMALENATFFPAEAKGGLGWQARAVAQASGGLVLEPQG